MAGRQSCTKCKVIDRDDAGPTGLAGFGEHFPHRHDQHQRDEQSDNRRERAGSRALSAELYSTCASKRAGVNRTVCVTSMSEFIKVKSYATV